MSIFDTRKPVESGKSGKITFPDTRTRTIIVGPGEYGGVQALGVRTTPQGTIDRFDPATGIKVVRSASEFSVHPNFDPVNPTDISATATGDTTIEITATADPGSSDGIEIHKSTTQGGPYSLDSTVEETDFNAPVEITGLTASTTYYFVLRSFLYDGVKQDAAFTAEVSATTGAGGAAPAAPGTPAIAEISRTATTMTLEATWTDVADETSYEWTAGSDDGTTWSDSATGLAAGSTSVQFVATRTNAEHTGFFCVKACNASGCSINSCNGFTVAGNLTAPSSLAATNPSGSDVDLDWSDMAGATVANETAIERRLVGGSFTEIDTVTFGTTHYDDNALADGDYEYRVRHRDTGTGDTSPYSSIDSVGIGTGGGGSDHPNEPAGYTQVSDRPFSAIGEDGWNAFDTVGLSIVSDATAPTSPPDVAQSLYPQGYTGGGSPSGTAKSISTTDDFYVAFTFKISSNWQGHDSQVNKILFIQNGPYPGSGPITVSAHGANAASLRLDMRLVPRGNEGSQSLGSPNLIPNLASGEIVRGTWHEIEINVVNNTAGNFDGEAHIWLDGVKITEYTDVMFFDDAVDPASGFQVVSWDPTWGGTGDTVISDQYQRMDHFYISVP